MTDHQAGRFIVMEGIDGCGKTTQIKRLENIFRTRGCRVYRTYEPTNGKIGTLIRQMLTGTVPTDQRTIATLFAADRTDHLVNEKNGIRQMVDDGWIVLCDRYYFSSYAYHARHVDMEWVIAVNRLNAGILRPDLTIFIDTDPKRCFQRIEKERAQLEMYEKLDIMTDVRLRYFEAFDRLREVETVAVVDGNGTQAEVGQRIHQVVDPFITI